MNFSLTKNDFRCSLLIFGRVRRSQRVPQTFIILVRGALLRAIVWTGRHAEDRPRKHEALTEANPLPLDAVPAFMHSSLGMNLLRDHNAVSSFAFHQPHPKARSFGRGYPVGSSVTGAERA